MTTRWVLLAGPLNRGPEAEPICLPRLYRELPDERTRDGGDARGAQKDSNQPPKDYA